MTKFNAIIIDDEPNIREGLSVLVKEYCRQVEVKGLACSAEEGRQLLNAFDIHLIFLDIAMPNENGFDFLSTITKEDYAIIFITAYEEYALKALKASAIDYLLKPVNPVELTEAVQKAVAYMNLRLYKEEAKKIYNESLKVLTKQAADTKVPIKKITVPEKLGFRIVKVKNIRYLEADSNYSIIHLSGFEKIVTSKSLVEFEKILDPMVFIRIHKSTIINMNYLKSFSSYQGHFAILDDNTQLIISRRRVNEFKSAVNTFAKSLD